MSTTAQAPDEATRAATPVRRRLLTGLRPTGRLHLGNYVGTLEEDLRLQGDPNYTCFFLVADFHALTTDVERAAEVAQNARETLLDMLASASLGRLNYPGLQAADILMVRGEVVPVGKDQASHIELTREIARRFNQMFGRVFPEPDALHGRIPKLPGVDGTAKMSKSLGN